MHTFEQRLVREILSSLNNHHFDNYDHYRFGERAPSATERLKRIIRSYFHRKGIGWWRHSSSMNWHAIFDEMNANLNGISHLYDLLADDYSKDLLVLIAAYRALGPTKVKLPLNTTKYWMDIKKIEEDVDPTQSPIPVSFLNWKLACFNFTFNNEPIRVYLAPSLIYATFAREQYAYRHSRAIMAGPGDVVIDGGGCYGDTALYFAQLAGPTGRVFSFEPLGENLSVFARNIQLNPTFADRIAVVKRALWNTSAESLNLLANGPATSMSDRPTPGDASSVQSISIDDFVRGEDLNKVSFIKMDIEGAELNALRGAEQTLRRFAPKLAICLYHNLSDFVSIPAYLDDLDVGYKFYLDHHTIHREESVLYAVVNDPRIQ